MKDVDMVCKFVHHSLMVICFDASKEAKRALDALLETGQFRDLSEVVSTALVNYQVIQRSFSKAGELISSSPCDSATERRQVLKATSPSSPPKTSQPPGPVSSDPDHPEIPALFALPSPNLEGLALLPVPTVANEPGLDPGPDRWLFGQYNKFLPVKASCRALLNILRRDPTGPSLSQATTEIATAACALGDYLKALDDQRQSRREDAFAAAFPSSASGSEGSRIRFSNQFVAGLKQDQLEGLPAALHLVALDKGKEPRLCLTRAGAEFAILPNPILDDQGIVPTSKFSEAEVDFLFAQIRQVAPEELSAYLSIIDAVEDGSNVPDSVDLYLRQRFTLPEEEDISKTFLTTQRTGAISRMADLGLISRQKQGLRVTYALTSKAGSLKASLQRRG